MPFFSDMSIRRKLTMMLAFTSGVAVLLVCIGFGFYESTMFRENAAENMGVLCRVLGENSAAALSFQQNDDTNKMLAALQHEPHVISATIFDSEKNVFASFTRSDSPTKPLTKKDIIPGIYHEKELITVINPILSDGEIVGYISIRTDTDRLYEKIQLYLSISLLIAALSLSVALLLSRSLRRRICDPINSLVEKIKAVGDGQDYSIRAEKAGNDEMGTLVDGFNAMLGMIERRNNELVQARDRLEERVKERTIELQAEITERTKAENELQSLATELQRSNSELQHFAYVASHDLQEPLRKIRAFGDRLSSKCADELGQSGKDYLERMQSAASRMQNLINALLTFSRVTTKAQPFTKVEMNEIISGVLSDLEVRIEKEEALVQIEEMPVIDADPMQMRQLMQNLIGNALKYRKPDESPAIKISGEIRRTTNEWQPLGPSAEEVAVIRIIDNGIGFENKFSERIFGVFQRLHGRGEYEGSGVGLAVCKKIVDRHHGLIAANSSPGNGSTFTVYLPIQQKSG